MKQIELLILGDPSVSINNSNLILTSRGNKCPGYNNYKIDIELLVNSGQENFKLYPDYDEFKVKIISMSTSGPAEGGHPTLLSVERGNFPGNGRFINSPRIGCFYYCIPANSIKEGTYEVKIEYEGPITVRDNNSKVDYEDKIIHKFTPIMKFISDEIRPPDINAILETSNE